MKQKNSIRLIFRIFLWLGIVLALAAIVVTALTKKLIPLTIIGFQAIIWLSIGGIGLFCIRRKERKREELLISGRRILADVTDVYLDRRFTVNGRYPYRISCQYSDEGTKSIHTFQSEALWFDPRPLMTDNQVEVCIDYNDFSRYAVDTQKLLNGYTLM